MSYGPFSAKAPVYRPSLQRIAENLFPGEQME